MSGAARLTFFCGKMAAGKSTLARELAAREEAVLLVQDEFLGRLFPGEIRGVEDFLRCSARLRDALAPHICELLAKGVSVVLDFPGNTVQQRAWFRELFERAGVDHRAACHRGVGCAVQAPAQAPEPGPAAGDAVDDRRGVRRDHRILSAAVRGRALHHRAARARVATAVK